MTSSNRQGRIPDTLNIPDIPDATSVPDVVALYKQRITEESRRLNAEQELLYLGQVKDAQALQSTPDYDQASQDPEVKEIIVRGRAAKQIIMSAMQPYVLHVASRYRLDPHDPEELMEHVSSGNIGLEHAIRKYDLDRATRLTTYATPWICQSIKRWRANNSSVHVPEHVKNQQLFRTYRQLKEQGMSMMAIQATININVRQLDSVRQAYLAQRRPISLDEPVINFDDTTTTLTDLLPVVDSHEIEHVEDRLDFDILINHIKRVLDPEDFDLFYQSTGLNALDDEPPKYKLLADERNVSIVTISRRLKHIRNTIIELLRPELKQLGSFPQANTLKF